ncbi:MAG: transporter substrate-binding domain-containing protein [Bacteroidales bacterium]
MKLKLILTFFAVLGAGLHGQSVPGAAFLSEQEQEWLRENGDLIRYAPNRSWAPGEYLDEDESHQGIISDYIRIFEDSLGIRFIRKYYDTWSGMYEALVEGEVDFLGAMQETEERQEFLRFTDPVIRVPVVVLVNSGTHADFSSRNLKGMRIAVMKDYVTQEQLAREHANYELEVCANEREALLLTSLGKTDGTLIDLMTASHLVELYGITNLSVGTELNETWDLSFAIRKEQETLASILDKIIRTLGPEEHRRIYNKWIRIEPVPSPNFFQRNYRILIISLVVFLLLSAVFVLYSLVLRRQVRKRTRQLDLELEAKNRAIARAHRNEARLESLFDLARIKASTSKEFMDFALGEITKLTQSDFGLLYAFDAGDRRFILTAFRGTGDRSGVSGILPTFQADDMGECSPLLFPDESPPQNVCQECHRHGKGSCPMNGLRSDNTMFFPIREEGGLEAILFLGHGTPFEPEEIKQIELLTSAVWKLLGKQKWQEELVVAKARAEESDRLKSAFLANMSHEIRTPMNGIIGFSDLLGNPDLSDGERKEYIDIIQSRTKYLLSVITDIIEISKIDSEVMQTNREDFQVDELMRSIHKDALPSLRKDVPVELRLQKRGGPASWIRGDEVKIRQVVHNLLSNAIKYTEEGNITLGYRSSAGGVLEISVSDTGVGIHEKYHRVIFERFRQGNSALAIEKGGTGLGLAIASSYVKMMGGEIHLESSLGKGSTFSVWLPLEPSDRVGGSDGPAPPRESSMPVLQNGPGSSSAHNGPVTLLIAEDQYVNFLYLREMLKGSRFRILHARDGREALDMFRTHTDIGLVLLDIKMPELDGYQVVHAIRKEGSALPVVAQTAYALADDRKKILEAGFDAYLSKPISREDLFLTLDRFL